MARPIVVDFASNLWSRLKEGWRTVPRGSLPKLLIGLVIAWLVAAGVTAAITTWAESQAKDADGNLTGWLHAWDDRTIRGFLDVVPFKFTDGIIFESPSNLFILIPVTILGIIYAAWQRRPLLAVAFALNYVLARFLIWTGWGLWDRQRPDFVEGGAAALAAHSFPSGHVLLTFTSYGLFVYLWAAASRNMIERVIAFALLLLLAFVVSAARLILGAHWPSDCIAGAVAGSVWLVGVILSLRWAEGRRAGATLQPT